MTSLWPVEAVVFVAAISLPVLGAEGAGGQLSPPASDEVATPKTLFETHCGACHSLELPRSQRLDRKTWRWVVDDMVNEFGATWITGEQQEIIIDYLAENYGPDRPQ